MGIRTVNRLSGVLLLSAALAPHMAAALSFTAPACGGTISGTVALTVSGGSAALMRVEFAMGSHPIGSALGPNFTIPWNSAEAMDGVSAIQASGFDIMDKPLGTTSCQIQVSNRQASLVVTAPDLSQILTGTAQVSVSGSDAIAFPAVWTLNVDGEEQSTVWTDNTWKTPLTVAFSLDTTRFPNGPHELHISMNSRTGPSNPQWVNWRGMVNQVIQVNNGHAWMDTSTGFQNLYLTPGETISIGCKRLYTDSVTGACGSVSYQSSNPSVASVDATGLVLAAQSGFAQILVTDGSRGGGTAVWVSPDPRVPHFQGNGVMRRGYEAGKSLFVIAPFFLDPPSLTRNPGLRNQAALAAVNTLGFGVYLNPRDTTTALANWKSSFSQTVLPKMQWARDNGFHLLLTGDDIFRQIGGDAWFTLNWPSGKQAVQYAVAQMAATGVAIGIEAIDEASSIWGDRPTPAGMIGQAPYLFNRIDCAAGSCNVDWPANPLPNLWNFALRGGNTASINTSPGSLFTVQNATPNGFTFQAASTVGGSFTAALTPSLEYLWFAGKYCSGGSVCVPAVPNDALSRMRSWMQVSPSPVAMAFPPLATSGPSVHGNWMGSASVSDYASDYFTSLKTRTTYPWSEGIQEMTYSMTESFLSRQSYLMLDRPQLMLVSLAGPSYIKQTEGASVYQAGSDALDQPGVSPRHVSAVMMQAAALGGAGLRLYLFESPADQANRASAPTGTYFQTGSNPSNLQPASWTAMAYASNLLTKVLQPYLLAAAQNSPAYGRNITTAVRVGANGTLLLVVNGNDWARTVQVDFSAFPHASGVARYHLTASGIRTDVLGAGQTGDPMALGPGETVAYLFPDSAAAMPLQQMTLDSTASMGQVKGVRYGYIYPGSSLGQAAVTCSATCVIAVDPQLGELYYQLIGTGGVGPEIALNRLQTGK